MKEWKRKKRFTALANNLGLENGETAEAALYIHISSFSIDEHFILTNYYSDKLMSDSQIGLLMDEEEDRITNMRRAAISKLAMILKGAK